MTPRLRVFGSLKSGLRKEVNDLYGFNRHNALDYESGAIPVTVP